MNGSALERSRGRRTGSRASGSVMASASGLNRRRASRNRNEARRTLLAERRQAFGVIGGRTGDALEDRLALQGLLESIGGSRIAGRASSGANASGEPAAMRAARARASAMRALAGHDPRHQAQPLGLRRIEPSRRGVPARRPCAARRARQEPGRAAVRDESDASEGEHEAGLSAAIAKVAGEGKGGAGAGRDAVHRRDHRLRQPADRQDDRVVAVADLDLEGRGVGLARVRVRSCPAQNARPAPVRITTRTAGFRSNYPRAARSAALIGTISALSASGRSRVIVATGSATSTRSPSVIPRSRPGGRRRARTARRSIGSSAPPDCSRTNSANKTAKAASPGRRVAARRRWRSGMPTRTRPSPPSSFTRLANESGSRIRTASRPSPVSELTLGGHPIPRRSRPHPPTSPQVAHRGVLQLDRPTPHDSRWSPLTTTSNPPAGIV